MERLRQMECVSTVKVIVKMAPSVMRRMAVVMADVIQIGKDVTAKVLKYMQNIEMEKQVL